MTQVQNIDNLWSELTAIKDVDNRIVAIHNDIQTNLRKYQVLAETDPYRLFDLLGGDDSDLDTCNWALPYSYENFIEENEIEFDPIEEKEWDLDEKSIEHAHDSGHWYVTGFCTITGPEKIELEFEFQYTEGYLDGIIGTPYNQESHGNHGILFY